MEKIKDIKNENDTIENEEVKTSTKTKTKTTEEILLEKLSEMQKQLDLQAETIANLSNKNSDGVQSSNKELLELIKSMKGVQKTNMVNVIYLENRQQLMFKLTNGTIVKANRYGQIIPLSYEDAVRLLNEHTETFERGALKFDEEHMYMLREKGIDVDKIDYDPLKSVKGFENLSYEEAKRLYDSFKPFQKDIIKTYVLDLFRQNKVTDELISVITRLNKYSMKDSFNGRTGFFQYFLDKIEEAEKLANADIKK